MRRYFEQQPKGSVVHADTRDFNKGLIIDFLIYELPLIALACLSMGDYFLFYILYLALLRCQQSRQHEQYRQFQQHLQHLLLLLQLPASNFPRSLLFILHSLSPANQDLQSQIGHIIDSLQGNHLLPQDQLLGLGAR